jgi:hypothetical protein
MPSSTHARCAPSVQPANSALRRSLATFWNSLGGRVIDGDVGVFEEAQQRGLLGSDTKLRADPFGSAKPRLSFSALGKVKAPSGGGML